MSVNRLLHQAAGGSGGAGVYVDDVFSTYLYEGNGSSTPRTIANGINLRDEGGLVWIKSRNTSENYMMYDSERTDSVIYSNANTDQFTNLVAYNRAVFLNKINGFEIDGNDGSVNGSSNPYVSWTFRKAPGFFDVVTYSGTGSAQTISHNLGSVPGMIMVKRISGVEDWICYHRSLGNTTGVALNQTSAAYTNVTPFWNATTPTDSEFTVGTHDRVNTSGHTYVAYLFAHDDQRFGTDSDEAIIKCGSYTGNGSSNGPTIDLGFEPQWLLVKSTTGNDGWVLWDTMRGLTVGGHDAQLQANWNGAEYNGYYSLDLTATGFKLTHGGAQYNGSGDNYIYIAIRRQHKPASQLTAADMFSPIVGTNYSDWKFDAGFPVDLHFYSQTSNNRFVFDRLRGDEYLTFNSSSGGSAYICDFDFMEYCDVASSTNNGWTMYNFKRTPGFFDMVAYKGTGSTSGVVKHNLGVTPELIIRKSRDHSEYWFVWSSALSSSNLASGNFYASFGSNQYYPGDSQFYGTAPTATEFVEGIARSSNIKYVAYLFASVPGISKIGTYSGTGANGLDIDCGFTNGARFVLTKRTDSTGDWYLFDSARGIVAGNDPYFFLNSTSYSNSTDYIEPLSSGFQLNNQGNATVNISGATYLFFAIA